MKMLFIKTNPVTGKINGMFLSISEEQISEILNPNGRCIQDVVPHLTPDEREFVLTGILPEDWDKTFAEEK